MSDELAAFEKKFRQRELHVSDCGAWTLSVRPGQIVLGAMVLASRSGALAMSDLTHQEMQDMGVGLALAERLAKQVFGAKRLNFLCLMMQDPIMHFHILPRYAQPVTRYGATWTDQDWPGPPRIAPLVTADATLLQIRDELHAAL